MLIDPMVAGLVLLAALMHAGWNTVIKLGHDRLTALALIKIPNMAIAAGALAFVDLPDPASWPYMLASLVVTCVYFFLLANAYRVSDLSLAYPIARGSSPLCVMALSYFVIGETPSGLGLASVLAISLGIAIIGFERAATVEHYRALAWAGGVGLTIALYTLIDGLGGRASGSPVGYNAAHQILSGTVIVTTAVAWRGREVFVALRRDLGKGIVGGAMMFGAYAIAIYAMTVSPLASVSALRETGVVFAALLGSILLGERFGLKRTAAAVLVAAGIITLVVFG